MGGIGDSRDGFGTLLGSALIAATSILVLWGERAALGILHNSVLLFGARTRL